MITEEFAKKFAHRWMHVWNAHDLESIMTCYADDIVFQSSVVTQITSDKSGIINGKTALKEYFTKALSVYPDLHFDLLRVLTCVNSIVLYYRSINDMTAAEYLEIDDTGKIEKVCLHYAKQTYDDRVGYTAQGLL